MSGWERKRARGQETQALDTTRIEKVMNRVRNLDRGDLLSYIETQENDLARLLKSYDREPAPDTLRTAHSTCEALLGALTVATGKLPVPPPAKAGVVPPRVGGERVR